MLNYVQPGDSITIPAPDDVTSGQGVQVGALFGVASTDALSGVDVALGTSGVYVLAKEPTTDTFAIGDEVEWDAANGHVTPVDTGKAIGVVVEPAGATDSAVRVRLA